MKKILIYGYGNPGRQDDGLGVLFAEMIKEWSTSEDLTSISTDSNYQLNIEDAYGLNKYDVVIFADASTEEIDKFKFEELSPSLKTNFSMHSVSPAFVLALCNEMYNEMPKAYLLHLKAYEWEFMAEVSGRATDNLQYAFNFMTDKLKSFFEL